jgi:hypothetical protein
LAKCAGHTAGWRAGSPMKAPESSSLQRPVLCRWLSVSPPSTPVSAPVPLRFASTPCVFTPTIPPFDIPVSFLRFPGARKRVPVCGRDCCCRCGLRCLVRIAVALRRTSSGLALNALLLWGDRLLLCSAAGSRWAKLDLAWRFGSSGRGERCCENSRQCSIPAAGGRFISAQPLRCVAAGVACTGSHRGKGQPPLRAAGKN